MTIVSQLQMDDMWLESLRKGRRISLRIASGSMAPLIRAGDLVRVQPITDTFPSIGDVVLIRSDGNWLVHRLVGRRFVDGQILFRQKGDASNRVESVPWTAISGNVTSVSRTGILVDLSGKRQKIFTSLLGLLLNLIDYLQEPVAAAQSGDAGVHGRLNARSGGRLFTRLTLGLINRFSRLAVRICLLLGGMRHRGS